MSPLTGSFIGEVEIALRCGEPVRRLFILGLPRDRISGHKSSGPAFSEPAAQAIVERGGVIDDFKLEVVLHAAASYRDSDIYIGGAGANVLGLAVNVRNCQRLKVKRMIYLQTAPCDGDPVEQTITLNHPNEPSKSSYAISKTYCRNACETAWTSSVS